MMLWYGHDMGWWGYAWLGIDVVLFWAALIAGIVAWVRYTASDRPGQPFSAPSPTPTPEEILAGRFARGEISETEYRERLPVLRDHARH